MSDDLWVTESEKGHGRIEKREVRVVSGIRWLTGREQWADLQSILQYRGYRTVKGRSTKTDRY
jgi:hypothetical protein